MLRVNLEWIWRGILWWGFYVFCLRLRFCLLFIHFSINWRPLCHFWNCFAARTLLLLWIVSLLMLWFFNSHFSISHLIICLSLIFCWWNWILIQWIFILWAFVFTCPKAWFWSQNFKRSFLTNFIRKLQAVIYLVVDFWRGKMLMTKINILKCIFFFFLLLKLLLIYVIVVFKSKLLVFLFF